jgi:hypothetical protein
MDLVTKAGMYKPLVEQGQYRTYYYQVQVCKNGNRVGLPL